MSNNIKNCLQCENNQFWIELRLVDEMNQPFGSLSGTLKDTTGKIYPVTLSAGYLLLSDLPAGPVELKLETKALLTEAKKHKPRPMPQASPAKAYADKNKGYQKSKIKYQYITLGDLWALEPQIIPDRHRASHSEHPLRMATNNSYVLEIKSLAQITLPALIHKTPDAGHYMDDYIVADDMQHGDLSEGEIINMHKDILISFSDDAFKKSPEEHFKTMHACSKLYSWYGDTSSLGSIMINRFQRNVTGKFKHSLLDSALKRHPNTDTCVNSIRRSLLDLLIERKMDLSDELVFILKNELTNGDYKISHSGFDEKKDFINGLVFSVHTLWAMEIYLTNVDIDYTSGVFSAEIKILAQDHFGLDKGDVKKHNPIVQVDELFKSWFILQRCNKYNYKPYITEMIAFREVSNG